MERLLHAIVVFFLKIGAWMTPFPWPKTYEGASASLELCRHIIRKGHKRVLFVTSNTPVRTGLVQPLVDELHRGGVAVTLFHNIQPDPTVLQIEEVVSLHKANRCDAVLVLGGGSAMDAAKVIAARARNPRKSILKMAGLFRVTWGMQALYAIPTTAGTGSEVSIGAVVTDTIARHKFAIMDLRLLPKAVALDGGLMVGVSPEMTAATGMDALTHAVEAYVSVNALSATDAYAVDAVKIILRDLIGVFANGADVEARHRMAHASYMAGKAFTQVGVGYVHAIAHNIGGLYHVPHGRANAIIMPYVLEYSLPNCAHRLAQLAFACGIAPDSADEHSAAKQFIERIKAMNAHFGIPAFIPELLAEDIPQIAQRACQEAHFTYAVPRFMTVADCESVVRKMLPPSSHAA